MDIVGLFWFIIVLLVVIYLFRYAWALWTALPSADWGNRAFYIVLILLIIGGGVTAVVLSLDHMVVQGWKLRGNTGTLCIFRQVIGQGECKFEDDKPAKPAPNAAPTEIFKMPAVVPGPTQPATSYSSGGDPPPGYATALHGPPLSYSQSPPAQSGGGASGKVCHSNSGIVYKRCARHSKPGFYCWGDGVGTNGFQEGLPPGCPGS